MRIGYPCINRSLTCRSNRTFRLKSYSNKMMEQTVRENLACLREILKFNIRNRLLFFRITSDLIPFASHPICTFPWQDAFRQEFLEIGEIIIKNKIRISMHPDQFTLINSEREDVFERSSKELLYHSRVMDLMGLDRSAKIQIHGGGVYGDKRASMRRFCRRFKKLDMCVRQRLVVENDEKSYHAGDCLELHTLTGIPVLFDVFHHQMKPWGSDIGEVIDRIAATWEKKDGIPMADYSSQQPQAPPGRHAESLNSRHFMRFLEVSRPHDMDIMLEIKDKEASAIRAAAIAAKDPRFVQGTK